MPQWLYLFRLKSAIWTGQNLVFSYKFIQKGNFHQKLSYKVLSPHWNCLLLFFPCDDSSSGPMHTKRLPELWAVHQDTRVLYQLLLLLCGLLSGGSLWSRFVECWLAKAHGKASSFPFSSMKDSCTDAIINSNCVFRIKVWSSIRWCVRFWRHHSCIILYSCIPWPTQKGQSQWFSAANLNMSSVVVHMMFSLHVYLYG